VPSDFSVKLLRQAVEKQFDPTADVRNLAIASEIELPRNCMIRPSEKSLGIAEDLLDYVHPGMTRAAALQEVAQMVDEMNGELLESIQSLLAELEQSDKGSNAVLINHLRHVLVDYTPWHTDNSAQHELFTSVTESRNSNRAAAGQMP
jgi:hypothetical protein